MCPYTFVRARLALEAMPVGARLVLIGDHAPAVHNLPRSLRAWGQEVSAIEPATEVDGCWRIAVCKRVE